VSGAPGGLPWLAAPLADALATQRGHALLVHAAPGIGAFEFALAYAQARLCEADETPRRGAACGRCGSCHLVGTRLHPDLFVLLPEQLRLAHGWVLGEDKPDAGEGGDAGSRSGKRKPSRQIRIDEVRGLIDWMTRTSSRGRGKMVVIHPADALNLQSASALLKTLEEPPPGSGLVLTAGEPEHLLPTVRSRCQRVKIAYPDAGDALGWLRGHGIDAPEVLLAAAGGLPLDALTLHSTGIDAKAWRALPRAVAAGQAAALAGWPVPQAVDALHKLCHDAMSVAVGGSPRFFPADALPPKPALQGLNAWARRLGAVARHDQHPWNEGLLIEALVARGREALSPPSRPPAPARSGLATLRA